MPIVATLASSAVAALSSYAIVTSDQTALRASPRDSAAQQAVLWQGDLLEVRGQRLDHLQVYDHRRERAGYVHRTQVRTTSAQPAEATELLAVLRFVRDTPGAEALGIGYAAAYLKAVPAGAMTAEPFDALGTLADRLARRASARHGTATSVAIAAHLEVAAGYGVVMKSHEQGDTVRVCYDGDAFRRVLAMAAATPEQRARAALGLTRPECGEADAATSASPSAGFEADAWRAGVLRGVDDAALPETLRNRLRLRRAGIESALAFAHARRDGPNAAAVRDAATRALQALGAVDKAELADDDQAEYASAAIRTGASRWGAEPTGAAASNRVALQAVPGEPGETCIVLATAGERAQPSLTLRRCTWGTVWLASASVSPDGRAVALAVQPLAGWRELWVFRRTDDGWSVDVLPPAPGTPMNGDVGYVEFAGWVPGGERLLVAREARIEDRTTRRFEVLRLDGLAIEKGASSPSLLAAFGRWQDAAWKRQTVSLR